ncbi:hypothetical protein OG698_08785 [Streptomyces sp. NBC_01003]|uniref:hypothetical protein n=1 Tax=Streptomyces sp. NBC_01003 TaxID=2903714 RepID=UPI00386E1BE8|nr:hypothetical protein OG698_08785 [Streptomyces sp. NBC_01003]
MEPVHIHVADGIVHLKRPILYASLRDVLTHVARTAPGVVGVTAQFNIEVP